MSLVNNELLELLRLSIMKSCNMIELFSLEKMNSLLKEYLNRHSYPEDKLIYLVLKYPGLLLPSQDYTEGKEFIPSLRISFEHPILHDYKDKIIKEDNKLSIKLHSLMIELPMNILNTFYGLPTKLSQIYRSLFPNTWPQANFNNTSEIIIHPLINDNMIVIVKFDYYHGYLNHINTITLLDNLKTNHLLKHHYTTLSLQNKIKEGIPFPTIYGLSNSFTIIDDNMDVKVSCYHPSLSFNNEINLSIPSNCKIPGDSTFGYITNKDEIDPHQYHYILRRLSRYLYEYPYIPYQCIMSEKDLPETIMYFNI